MLNHVITTNVFVVYPSSAIGAIGTMYVVNNMAAHGHIWNPGMFLLPKAAVGGALVGAAFGYFSPVLAPLCLSTYMLLKLKA